MSKKMHGKSWLYAIVVPEEPEEIDAYIASEECEYQCGLNCRPPHIEQDFDVTFTLERWYDRRINRRLPFHG